MRRTTRVMLHAFCIVLPSCASQPKIELTTDQPVAAREVRCEFELVPKLPPGDYRELGTLGYSEAGATWHSFKQRIRQAVCEVGGDVVVTMSNDFGHIVRATVFQRL